MTNIQVAETTKDFLKNIKNFESADKTAVISSANRYTSAKRTKGDVPKAGNELFNVLRTVEAKYGIAVFTPNEPTIVTMDKVAEVVDIACNKLNGTKAYSCSFNSVAEANAWLAAQTPITVRNISVSAICWFGIHVKSVSVEYSTSDKPIDCRYALCEIDKFRAYVRSKPEKVCRKWQEKNPSCRIVDFDKKQCGWSLIGGNVGFLRFIKETYFVAYSY